MSKLQTTNYAGWDGKIRFGLDPSDSGVSTWINEGTGTITVEMPFDGPHWQYLGVAPLPRTRWDWFIFDYHHGRLMRYPWIAVVRFSVNNWLNWNKPSAAWRRGEK